MDFPLFFLCDFARGGAFFISEKNSEKAKHPQIFISFGGNVGKT